MQTHKQNDIVRRNIEIVKIILQKTTHLYEIKSEKKSQCFHAFIHRNKGEIQFPHLTVNTLHNKEWAPISFYFSAPVHPGESFCFEISNFDYSSFSWNNLEPEALKNLKETIKTIQFMARFLPNLHNLSAILREFSSLHLDTFIDKISSQDLIHEAWHSLTKEECEKKLLSQIPGTFLFRKDPFAKILENLLSQEHKEPIQCITLSYLSQSYKSCDLTCVRKNSLWTLYNDDPTLVGNYYPSIHALLNRFRSILKTPLFH